MTTTPPDAPSTDGPSDGPSDGPRVTRDEVRDLGRLRRSRSDRRIAGVAGGLARHLDVDPLVLRVAFVVLVFFGGAGLILYGACWLLVPEEGTERATVTLDDRSRSIALLIVGALAALSLVGGAWGNHAWFPWPLVVVGLVVWLVVGRRDRTAPADPSATPPAQTYGYAPPPPPDPRRRGPVLFWITLAVIALAVGVLGILDLSGLAVAHSAYPATALAVTALMLLVGSVWGRAGGLILLGFVCAFATAGSTLADEFDGEHISARPTSAAQVDDSYRVDAGEVVLDLTRVRDLEALDGRTIDLQASVGHLQLVLPDHGLDVTLNTDINGPGGYHLFTHDGGGVDEHLSDSYDGGANVPAVTLNTRLDLGGIDVEVKR